MQLNFFVLKIIVPCMPLPIPLLLLLLLIIIIIIMIIIIMIIALPLKGWPSSMNRRALEIDDLDKLSIV